MKPGAQFKHTRETLVLAYELHTDGVTWHLIERYLGRGIRHAIVRAERDGLRSPAA
jgi:hypothetical protein